MKSAWVVVAASLAACTDPAIEMSLALPSTAATQGFDLSCTGAVSVSVLGRDLGDQSHAPDVLGDCVDLPSPPKTFADVERAIRGRFSFALPGSGLAGVELSGVKGSCRDQVASRESVFYGGAPGGGDHMTVPLVPNISCDKATTYDVSVVDLYALVTMQSCGAPIDLSSVFAADMHPRLLGDAMPPMLLERGASRVLALLGSATVASYAVAASDRTCIAVGSEGTANGGVACVNPAAPTLCGNSGQLEVATLPLAYAERSREPSLVAQYGPPVFGAVFEPTNSDTEIPIPGATVELADPARGKVFYLQRGADRLTRIDGATATGADGLFVAYLHGEPTNLIVKAAGHAPQTFQVASTPEFPSTLLAALPRQ